MRKRPRLRLVVDNTKGRASVTDPTVAAALLMMEKVQGGLTELINRSQQNEGALDQPSDPAAPRRRWSEARRQNIIRRALWYMRDLPESRAVKEGWVCEYLDKHDHW